MNRKHSTLVIVAFALVLLFLPGCSGKKKVAVQEEKKESLACIAVIPTETPIDLNVHISYQQAQPLEKGAAHVDTILMETLGGTGQFRFATQKQMDAAMDGKKGVRLDQLKSVANTLSCNGVLTTSVNRYRQRVGSALSVDSAASATIQMKLISVVDGQVLWEDVFNETQQPLLSNLFSFNKASQRGLKWITVEELASDGVKEMLARCPYIEAQ